MKGEGEEEGGKRLDGPSPRAPESSPRVDSPSEPHFYPVECPLEELDEEEIEEG